MSAHDTAERNEEEKLPDSVREVRAGTSYVSARRVDIPTCCMSARDSTAKFETQGKLPAGISVSWLPLKSSDWSAVSAVKSAGSMEVSAFDLEAALT
eukprot:3093420-Rhodomonas_salina.3